ncbi:hypothetical protein [Teredinibacter sp. KSP-S5-2]|uniref:hypothetical protein n=1 Tax=Teredinibacter sp. KSP-S5-2 TaxID=3034506 RepID=UPI0029343750|nr:hypothetical protein [Teredinibacter sp. KSP-S5-2]WNO10591.1 hypothetical protein P5V12_05330 [Teredinibacter sp. KSP-S5-2]
MSQIVVRAVRLIEKELNLNYEVVGKNRRARLPINLLQKFTPGGGLSSDLFCLVEIMKEFKKWKVVAKWAWLVLAIWVAISFFELSDAHIYYTLISWAIMGVIVFANIQMLNAKCTSCGKPLLMPVHWCGTAIFTNPVVCRNCGVRHNE